MARRMFWSLVLGGVWLTTHGCAAASDAPPAKPDAAAGKPEKKAAPQPRPDPPAIALPKWQEAFHQHPEWLTQGVHEADQPEQALVATGSVPLAPVRGKTGRDRQIGEARAELAAKRELVLYFFEREKQQLRCPPHLERLVDDVIRLDAYTRTVTVSGLQTAATWWDEQAVWCTVIVAEDQVRRAKDFAQHVEQVGGQRFLELFRANKSRPDLYRAFEFAPGNKDIRAELAQAFVSQGQKVAAFVIQEGAARLPPPDDPLARFLAGVEDPHWRAALAAFQADEPDLERALDAFLHALDTQYANPDAFNYAGVCCQKLGWRQLACVLFEQALAQSPQRVHRYALTNLGLCCLELGDAGKARTYLNQAVKEFPDESWSARARRALQELDQQPTSPAGAEKPGDRAAERSQNGKPPEKD